jgi:hypothetical protein
MRDNDLEPRLAAIHSLARFIGLRSPEHVVWSGQIRTIPPKRAPRSTITYLEKSEMDALLNAPDQSMDQGRRDHALLLFLYNTGARADEAAQTKILDLALAHSSRDHSLVLLCYKLLKPKNLADDAIPGLSDEFLLRVGSTLQRESTLVVRGAASAPSRWPLCTMACEAPVSSRAGLQPAR